MNKKQSIILIVVIFLVVLLIIGGTYAYWLWTSNVNKNVVFNTVDNIEDYVVYDEGSSLFTDNFQPKATFCESASTTISFYKKSEMSDVVLYANVYMDVNSIGEHISASKDVYWVVTVGGNGIDCSDGLDSSSVVSYGLFNSVVDGSTLNLLKDVTLTLTEQEYTVWIWIDSAGTSLSNLSGETIDTNVWTEISMYDPNYISTYQEPILHGAGPVLEDGMIPVVISDDGTVTTVSASSSDWYSYENKKWANMVLVTEGARNTYLNSNGVVVDPTHILAYYVWVPRFKYNIWTVGTGAAGSEQEIDIYFESKDAPKAVGTLVDEYRTHPAFTFGEDEVNGIWVGKFELTGNIEQPTILPNKSPIISQKVGRFFLVSLLFAGGTLSTDGVVTFEGSDFYGLTTANVDSHMMKNSEWGASAYLSHSKYGKNGNIRINNYYNTADANGPYMTGCGALTDGEAVATTCGIIYGEATEYPQSTTGNISGIFDMSGGVWDHVMAGYNATVASSGFTTATFPDTKYYDKYTVTAVGSFTILTNGGHALRETNGWYGEYAYVPNSTNSWLIRGRYAEGSTTASSFTYGRNAGAAGNYHGTRAVLIPM